MGSARSFQWALCSAEGLASLGSPPRRGPRLAEDLRALLHADARALSSIQSQTKRLRVVFLCLRAVCLRILGAERPRRRRVA